MAIKEHTLYITVVGGICLVFLWLYLVEVLRELKMARYRYKHNH